MSKRVFKSITLLILITISNQLLAQGISNQNTDTIRGLIKPRKEAILSSQISGQITEMGFKPGERFSQNDLLVRFDCAMYEADLNSARARFQAEQKQYENNRKLLELNAISNIEVELSRSEVDVARAETRIKQIITEHCLIRAPFNGRVIEAMVNEFESVGADQELISILDDQDLEIELIVPSSWLTSIREGETFSFIIDETGGSYQASITQIGAIVDPVSQTVRLLGEFQNSTDNVLSGMSGTASFNRY
jgi:RND family efflux transporter MFP subunit